MRCDRDTCCGTLYPWKRKVHMPLLPSPHPPTPAHMQPGTRGPYIGPQSAHQACTDPGGKQATNPRGCQGQFIPTQQAAQVSCTKPLPFPRPPNPLTARHSRPNCILHTSVHSWRALSSEEPHLKGLQATKLHFSPTGRYYSIKLR